MSQGIPVEQLETHRDRYFSQWSAERPSESNKFLSVLKRRRKYWHSKGAPRPDEFSVLRAAQAHYVEASGEPLHVVGEDRSIVDM